MNSQPEITDRSRRVRDALTKCSAPDVRFDDRPSRFDWRGLGVRSPYLILFTARSGSTWLTSLLVATGVMGEPHEFFNEDAVGAFVTQDERTASIEDYLTNVVRRFRSPSGVFGAEVDGSRLDGLEGLVDVPGVFPKTLTSVVVLTRKALVPQAISAHKAALTGIYHRWREPGTGYGDPELPLVDKPEIQDQDIWNNVFGILGNEDRIEAFVRAHGFVPLRLTYEDLVTCPELQVERLCARIVPDWDGRTLPPPTTGPMRGGTPVRLADERDLALARSFQRRFHGPLELIERERTRLDPWSMRQAISAQFGLKLC